MTFSQPATKVAYVVRFWTYCSFQLTLNTEVVYTYSKHFIDSISIQKGLWPMVFL